MQIQYNDKDKVHIIFSSSGPKGMSPWQYASSSSFLNRFWFWFSYDRARRGI